MDDINITLYHLTIPTHLEGIKANGGLAPGQEGGLSELQEDANMIQDSETKVRTYTIYIIHDRKQIIQDMICSNNF